MTPQPYLPHRRSLRLQGHDYTQAGAYFVTVCTWERACVFGDVVGGIVRLSALGRIVEACWEAVPSHRPAVEMDAFVVMPNHVHGIVVIADEEGATSRAPTADGEDGPKPTLGGIVGAFKAAVTREAKSQQIASSTRLWQRNFYEHLIRSEAALARVRQYIEVNPARWDLDRDNPAVWR